ncbi:MAG: hypothetical protein ACOX6L_06660 [Syntrophomonadaceae bacterium]|jgi:Holliday junction resolvase-like predicted endonuclease
MAKFTRGVDLTLINSLKTKPLFQKRLRPDIDSGDVFPAIRNNRIDFYCGGGKLFSYSNDGFKTHQKYASIIDQPVNDYISATDLSNACLIKSFDSGYGRIKELCQRYSGIEATGVSYLLKRFSIVKFGMNENIVAIDIEAAMLNVDDEAAQTTDRIDLVLYNQKARKIHFVEVKDYSNKELWSKGTPKVVVQIERYEKQIIKRKAEILTAYQTHVNSLNKLFDLNINFPQYVSDRVCLYIFGFDDDQKKGRLQTGFMQNPAVQNSKIHTYAKGDPKTIAHLKSLIK